MQNNPKEIILVLNYVEIGIGCGLYFITTRNISELYLLIKLLFTNLFHQHLSCY